MISYAYLTHMLAQRECIWSL